MPNIKEVLKEFVATANAGQYETEGELLSRFPELNGYDINTLKEFVATANAGQYASEDDLLSKFPEFNQPVKKKEESLQLPWTEKPKQPKSQEKLSPFLESIASERSLESRGIPSVDVKEYLEPPTPTYQKAPKPEEPQGYWENLYNNVVLGVNSLDKMVASIPETAINILAIPQNVIAYATGWDVATNADQIKEYLGVRNPVLDWLNEEEKNIKSGIDKFNQERYESSGIYDNIVKGNYGDAFELLTTNIAQSVPVSLAMMAGGAMTKPAQMVAGGTVGFLEEKRGELSEMDPDMPEIEKTIKALGMASSETVFEALGTGTIGQVYKDILKKEGAEKAKTIFRDGIANVYKNAIKKYGVPAGLVGEGIEEAATQITQNVITGRPAFEGAADAFIVGSGAGAAFTTPITAMKAKKIVGEKMQSYDTKVKIEQTLKNTDKKLDNVFNVSVAEDVTPEQLTIASFDKSRDLLVKDLDRKVKAGTISENDAKQSLYVFDKVQQVSSEVNDLDISVEDKAKVATLLQKRRELEAKVKNKDEVLVQKEKSQIQELNNQIQLIISKLASLKDDEQIPISVSSLEEIPEQFRDRAVKKEGMQVEGRKKIFGLPIGEKTTKVVNDGYRYTLTGKEAKDYAIQEQTTSEIPIQPEARVGEEVAQGEPQAEPQVATQETVQEEVVTPSEEAPATEEELTAALERISLPEEAEVEATAEPATAELTTSVTKSLEPRRISLRQMTPMLPSRNSSRLKKKRQTSKKQ